MTRWQMLQHCDVFRCGNGLQHITAGALAGLTLLDELYLANNELTTLPPRLFSNLTTLTILEMDNTNLVKLDSSTF